MRESLESKQSEMRERAGSAPEPTRGNSRGIPDIEFIKRHVPIADVARSLDIRVVGNTAHCWRPENHEHGDRTPSVWFSRRSNKGQCMVCDRHTWSNVDLVQLLLGCSTAEAIQWIAKRWPVPNIQRKHIPNHLPTLSRVGCGSAFEGLVRSGLLASLSGAEVKLLIILAEFSGAKLSYSAMQRFSGVGRARIKPALEHFRRMGMLKIKTAPAADGLRSCSTYEVAWNDPGFHKLLNETHQATSREIAAEKELRKAERAGRRRAPIPRYYSVPLRNQSVGFPSSATEPAKRTQRRVMA